MTHDEKLDKLLDNQNKLFTELRVHIAKDEDQWRRVAEAEEDIAAIALAAGKLSRKHAALVGSIGAGAATIASVITKAFL